MGADIVQANLTGELQEPSAFSEFAYKLQIPFLYKFRAFATDQDKEFVHQIIEDGRVYFARPSQLNDKRDLRPRLKVARETTVEKTRAILAADAERVWLRNGTQSEELIRQVQGLRPFLEVEGETGK